MHLYSSGERLICITQATKIACFLPSLSSPKFPQPIFLPTLKLGPTMRTPEDVEELGREPCPLLPGIPFVVRCLSSLSLLGWSMILVKYLCQQAGRKELEYTLFSSEQKFISKRICVGVQESHGNSWSSFGTRSGFLMHLDNVPEGRLCSWEFSKGRLLLVSYLGKRRDT